MKRKGISLIVLIITCVVIIILATAIIVNIAQTNMIENAKEAVVKQDFKTMQDELTLYIADNYADTLGKFKSEDLKVTEKTDIAKIIPSIVGTEYEEYVVIEDGNIAISEDMPEKERKWAMEALGLIKTTTNRPTVPEQPEIPVEPEPTATPVVTINTIVENENATITGNEFAYNNPVVPVGFKAVNTEKATWNDENKDGRPDGWNDGLVLLDGDDNEYVWIPVDGTNVTYSKWNGSKNTDMTVTKDQVEDDILPNGITSEIEQISAYGGFYVARYEAGLPDSQTTEELMKTKTFSATDNNRIDIGKAQSKYNKIVWNRIDYNNAKIVSENVMSTNYVQSGLITGTQWDTMLTFLSQVINVDADWISWGNYYDRFGYAINGYYRNKHEDSVYTNGEYNKSTNGYLLLPTGKFGSVISKGSPKNIFDVAGNVWEWSTETVKTKGGSNTTVGNKVLRGGSYNRDGWDFIPSYRNGYDVATNNYPTVGFRFVLYVK